MKITIDAPENGAPSLGTVSTKSAATNIDNSTQKNMGTAQKSSATTKYASSFKIDINGNVMDNNAYTGHGKTLEDVMQEAESQDIVARRNYMAVMSNTMSKEDFAKLQSDGTHPGNTEIDTVVTIIDHIRAALIKGGKEVHGFTDKIAQEAFEDITGDKIMAENLAKQFSEKELPLTDENLETAGKAWEKAKEITELPEAALKYMVENKLSPTIENLYVARYSGGNDAGKQGRGYFAVQSAYLAKKADNFDWDSLKPQIEKVINEADYESNEEALKSGRWLIEKGVPLTAENFVSLSQLKGLKLPLDNKAEIAATFAAAISDGKNPLMVDLLDSRSNLEKAVQYVEDIKAIEPKTVEKVVLDEQVLNLKNLVAAQKQIIRDNADRPGQSMQQNQQTQTQTKASESNINEKIISAQRTLLETSLIMTVTANLRLLRSGFSIETAPLEQLVSQLKDAESAIKSQLVGSSDRHLLYTETLTKVNEISVMPASLVGRMSAPLNLNLAGDSITTLNEVHAAGTILKATYEKAGELYEQVMTAPRRDMGDSIHKAFRNVDDILIESDLALTDANRRAIRILGYNGMEINNENIDAVKEKDAQLNDILAKMSPGTVLSMIREGVNPLKMTLDELQATLNGKNENIADALDSYSHFLAKLDRKGDITKEERSVYIGVYRLLRQIEKGESRAVGSLINAEMDFSLGNLLTAIRSSRRQGLDYSINDDFGGVSPVKISDSLETSLEKLQQTLNNNNNPSQNEADLREQLHEIIEKLKLAEADEIYINEQLKDIREIKGIENDIISALLDSNQPVTVNNLLALLKLTKKPSELHEKAKEHADETELDNILSDAKERLINDFTDEERAVAAYDNLSKVMTDIFARSAAREQATTLDIKELSNMCRQINLRAALKTPQINEERYDIPVEIDGEITSINLLIRHDSISAGKVSCTLTATSLGLVTAEFTVNNGKVNGHITVNETEGLKKLSKDADNLYTSLHDTLALKKDSLILGDIHFIKSNNVERKALSTNENQLNTSTEEKIKSKDAEKVSNRELYLVAKAFITFIQREGR